jgi:hypothetical protein
MRYRRFAAFALTACITGCATAPPPIVAPSDADKALAAKWESLKAGATDVARENINHTLTPEWAPQAQMLAGNIPATAQQLAGARGYIADKAASVERAKTWPAPTHHAIRKTAGPIVVDGKPDEAWAKAELIPICYPCPSPTRTDRPAVATCRLLWDEQFLYAFYEVPDAHIVTPYTKRDQDVSQADCVELFILPEKRFGQYWEFNFAPTGVVYDALQMKRPHLWGADVQTSENVAGMKLATIVRGTVNKPDDKDEGYTVEVAIPWSEVPAMTHGPHAGDVIHGLIGWADRTALGDVGKLSYFSNTPDISWFHNIWGYSEFRFE